MLEFEADDGPEVDAIEGYLLAVPRALAARVRVDPKDRYYRNADLDYCFAVRAWGMGRSGWRCRRPGTGTATTPTHRSGTGVQKELRSFPRALEGHHLSDPGFRGYHRHR